MIHIVLADSENIYRVGIEKVFALEDDIRVIAQADTLGGLHGTIQRVPTDATARRGQVDYQHGRRHT
jgi:DNA-binding NarL/FixJ family response regulator